MDLMTPSATRTRHKPAAAAAVFQLETVLAEVIAALAIQTELRISAKEATQCARFVTKLASASRDFLAGLADGVHQALDSHALIYPSAFHYNVRVCVMICVVCYALRNTVLVGLRSLWEERHARMRQVLLMGTRCWSRDATNMTSSSSVVGPMSAPSSYNNMGGWWWWPRVDLSPFAEPAGPAGYFVGFNIS